MNLRTISDWQRPVLIRRVTPPGTRIHRAIFRCHCGSEFEAGMPNVASGTTRSCGCLLLINPGNTKHGHAANRTLTRTYSSWRAMINRCTRLKETSYPRYGGRGIKICERWLRSFENFLADMGERPEGCSLERKRNSEGYSPENCQWATPVEQANNRRSTRLFEWRGQHLPLRRIVEESATPIAFTTIYRRIHVYGWDVERAVLEGLKQ